MSKSIKNKVIIDDNIVRKKKNERLIELYNYFDTIGFDSYPKIINTKDEYFESEKVNKSIYYEEIKGVEFIKTVSILHNKTSKYIDVSKNKYRLIYEKLMSNVEYLKDYYEKMISNIEEEVFMSPSHYLYARNYTILDSSLKYAQSSLKKWFKMVQYKSKERVCIVHNNLSLDHFIKGDKNYLLSFDNYLVDTPILDLYNFYKKEGFKLDFNYLFDIYHSNNNLSEEEKLLLNILISIPPKIIEVKDEYLNTINIKDSFNYISSGMNIVNKNK